MDNEKINEWAARFGMAVIIKYKWILFLLVLIWLGLGFLGLGKMVFDSSNESFLPENDPTVVQNDLFKEIFGNEEFLFIYIEADDIFHNETLNYIRGLSGDIKENLPFVKDVVSLTDVEYIETTGEGIKVEDLIGEEIPTDQIKLREIRNKAMSKKVYLDRIISRDGKKTGIAVSFERFPDVAYIPYRKNFSPLKQSDWPHHQVIMGKDIFSDSEIRGRKDFRNTRVEDPRKLIAPALDVILARHPAKDFKVLAVGVPLMDYESERIISRDGEKLGLVALLASVILLLLIFRSLTGMIAPFFVLFATMVILYGILGWLKIPLSLTSMIISPLILVISVSYSIHVINHFQNSFKKTGNRLESVRYAFYHSTWPCFLTAFTTAVGFMSFLVVDVKPIREMGIACALGVFIAYVLVMMIVPGFFSVGKNREVAGLSENAGLNDSEHIEGNWLTRWADFVIRRAGIITIIAAFIVLFFAANTLNVRVESDMMEMIGDDVKMVRDTRYITERLGGIYSFEVFIELPKAGMAKDPEVLKALDKITLEIGRWDSVNLTMSVNDIIKDLNMTMNGNDERFYGIPGSRELIAQYLLLYEMSGGESAEDWVDYDYKRLRLSVQVTEVSLSMGKKFEKLQQVGLRMFPPGTKIGVVGDIPIMLRMMEMLTTGQVKSILVALLVITLIMMAILKSVKLGMLSMVPNVLPVLAIAGAMGFLGFFLDIMTVMIAPMIVGIAVDDTVHYMIHFKQEYEKSASYLRANRDTFARVGRAILFTSVILSIGFSILGLSVVKSLFHMAVLSSLGILAALAADLLITPVLFVYLKPFHQKQANISK